jgi:hypothetical protein
MEMYLNETRGIKSPRITNGLFQADKVNGFAVGKKWMNVTIEMWREDIKQGKLWRWELEQDFPAWFLDKFLPG